MSLWDGLFSHLRLPVAQILLTRNDIADVSFFSLEYKAIFLMMASALNTLMRKTPSRNYLTWV
jgi:glutamate 5-kinase